MSLDGTFVRFKSTMKYRRLFVFMHSVTCSFHFKFAEIANFNSVTYQQFLPTDNYTREIMKVLLKVYDYLFSFVCVQLHSVLLGPLSRPRNPRSFWPATWAFGTGMFGPHLDSGGSILYTTHRVSEYFLGDSGVINVLTCESIYYKIFDHQ